MSELDLSPPNEVNVELSVLFATMQDSTREWMEGLGDVPLEAMIWQPYPNGPSIGGILLHLINCEWYWLRHVSLGEEKPGDSPAYDYDSNMNQYLPHWPAPPRQPLSWYLEQLYAGRERSLEAVLAVNDPMRAILRREKTLTFRWILAHVVEHDSYHGGQTVLLHEMWKQLQAE